MEPATRLRIALRPSGQLALLLGAGHLAAIAAVFTLDLPLWAAISIGVALGANGFYQGERIALLRMRSSIVAFEIDRDGAAALATRDGAWHEAMLLGSSFVSASLIVLNLRVPQTRAVRHVVMMGDSADAETMRALRVMLRWSLRISE